MIAVMLITLINDNLNFNEYVYFTRLLHMIAVMLITLINDNLNFNE